jgi:DNA repair exonuclease SbcCD ATPase subunit
VQRDEADTRLAALRDAQGRVASAMFAIDSHPALGFLRSGGLRGRTEATRAAIVPDVDALWSDFNALNDMLESARLGSLGRKVTDAEIANLNQAAGLAARLEPRTAAALNALNEVDRSWNACGAAIAPLADALSALTKLAGSLGDLDTTPALNQRAAALSEAVMGDPVGAAPAGVLAEVHRAEIAALTADADAARTRLATQVALREAYPARIAELETQVEAVRTEESRTANAYRTASEKFASVGLPPAPSSAAVLAARVVDLDKYRQAKRWNKLADEATALQQSIARAKQRAAELRDAADGLLARRDELRGRLDAYRAKAARHRLDENDALAQLHAKAHELLYTAPCELPEATRAVFAYQRALTRLVDAPHGATSPAQTAPKEAQ